jgi:hypothetical protein
MYNMDELERISHIPKIDHASRISEDLAFYGLTEVETGVIEDTYENRKIMRKGNMRWIPLYDEDGEPTGTCQVLTSEMMSASSYASLEDKRVIMVDPNNLNSDYKTGINLLLEHEAKDLAPAWVIAASKFWNMVELKREELGDPNHYPSLLGPPLRCTYVKADGIRCQFWTGGRHAEQFCRVHMPKAAKANINFMAKARSRLAESVVASVDELERLRDEAVSEPVRLGAAKELLDRAGIRAGFEIESTVDVNVRPASEIIESRLSELRKNMEKRAMLEAALRADEIVVEDDESNGQ